MTPGERAGVFESSDDIDLSEFRPKSLTKPAIPAAEVRAISEAANFKSREPQPNLVPKSPKREPRRYRTGRNVQLNIKARSEAIEAFYAIADRQGWVLGETFERAVESLERELEQG